MDSNINLDEASDQMIDKELKDNIEEEIIRCRQRRKVVHRDREEGHDRLINDYFSANPMYTETQFQRRFHTLNNHDEYFQMRIDALRQKNLFPLQKCTTVLRILTYGSLANSVDVYVQIGICAIFGNWYLRRPNNEDTERLLQMEVAHRFSNLWIWHAYFGIVGSNNDITMLNGSNVFDEVLSGHGIYLDFATFAITILMSQGEKQELFAQR
ncbi:hypothetical protein JHK82_015215 [Glycine max]|uniref:Uncharacterized protein n=1 Tax=Glycine max TaxID=3847 RepID=A0A0R0JLD1_SOYBN|nr:hypothetical protein JHK85_015595 [Glycine max]KAG5045831.1 hypothetical protein JHK86_015237 [Glycine max]KAG5148334.1 hypothetical protein JHK82_015215 [Glycine max]